MREVGEALTFAVVFGFVWGLVYLKYRKRREEREWLHRERVLALEKGIPLPELPPLDENGSAGATRHPDLLPKVSLGCGLLLVFLGMGMIVTLQLMRFPDPEVPSNLWGAGFVPLMLGFGCLIYYWLIRRARS